MNPWAIIPLVSCIAYATLLVLVLQQAKSHVNRMFALFLFACGSWSFSTFLLDYNPSASGETLIFWNSMVLVLAMWANFACYHFVRAYTNRRAGIITYIGYAITLTMLAFAVSGNMVKDVYFVNGFLYHDIGPWLYVMVGTLTPLLFIGMWLLISRLRSSTDPVDRNRTMYLLVGWGIMGLWAAINANVPVLAGLPTDHFGALANALIIAYAIGRFRLLDIRFVARRGLAYIILGLGLIGIWAGAMVLEFVFLPELPHTVAIITATILAVVLVLLSRPLRSILEERVDRLFHRETYIYRQALISFSAKVGSILDLDEIANEMLTTISRALRLTKAVLLFQETSSGDFITSFVYPQVKDQATDKLKFSADNPVTVWLAKEDKPLNLKNVADIPQLKALWTAEKLELEASGLVLLCPIKSRGRLIGILALGKKQVGRLFYPEDMELIATMANQASIVIENAQLYTEATIRANTDGLTELYNHRNFHERIEQECARGARFGSPFSLIMLDIDLFKTYNDIYGHQAGDRILRKMAENIKGSIRSIDIAFRYGGEEFTAILPETRLDDAYNVAERIRRTIESKMSSKAMPITVSLGVACWPTDGVTKEEVIASADAALYRAKQTGRNRTCLSSDVVKRGTVVETGDKVTERGALSIIYALAATVDAKDHYTYGHSKKVSEYAVATAEALALPKDRISTIRAAALLHDIGKIGVPDSILNKQGPLTEAEWEPIKEHPQLGVEILRHVIDLINCLPAILHHHEHFDGTGYPFGLQGSNIPLEARLLAIADAYDAMTSLRPYRKRLSPQEAITELKRCAGTQFDPELIEVFCKLMQPAISEELEIR